MMDLARIYGAKGWNTNSNKSKLFNVLTVAIGAEEINEMHNGRWNEWKEEEDKKEKANKTRNGAKKAAPVESTVAASTKTKRDKSNPKKSAAKRKAAPPADADSSPTPASPIASTTNAPAKRANVSKRPKRHGDFSHAYEQVKGYSAASKPVVDSDPDDEDITFDEDKNTSKCSAVAATAVTTGAANASDSDADRSFDAGSKFDKKKVPGKEAVSSDDDRRSESGSEPDKKKEFLKSSRDKIVYVPLLLQPPAKDEDINCTRFWSKVKKKNPVIIQVLSLLTSKYKKQKRIPFELRGCNVHDLFYMELKRHGCHIMFAPKQSCDKHDSPRKVTAVIITETVQRSPEKTYSFHYGLSIRFHCGDIKAIQCLLHRVLSFVYWDNHLCKADKDRVTHLYLRLVKDLSPSLFSLRETGNEQHEVMRMFGFLDAVDKDDYESYYWKDGNDIYAPNPLSHVESRVGINIQSVYHQLGGEGVVQSPSVVTQVPLANSSFFFIDPGPKNEFRSVYRADTKDVKLYAHNMYLGWFQACLTEITEDIGGKVAKDVKEQMLKALEKKKTYRYIPTRAGATGLFGNSRCCAWISVIKLLWKNDPATAKAMRLMMEKDKAPFEDMKLFKASKGSKDVTLNKLMAQWKYQLQKVQCTNGLELHETLLARETVGLFLCLLIDDHGQSTHTVGVHKSEEGIGFIMDPELKKPIHLNSLLDFSKCLGGKRCIGISVVIKILPPKGNKMN